LEQKLRVATKAGVSVEPVKKDGKSVPPPAHDMENIRKEIYDLQEEVNMHCFQELLDACSSLRVKYSTEKNVIFQYNILIIYFRM